MNDEDRQALRRRILERLGWMEKMSGGWIAPGQFSPYGPSPPDHTRDANAALRDLAPLLVVVHGEHGLYDAMVNATEGWISSEHPDGTEHADMKFDEHIALALCLAALPK